MAAQNCRSVVSVGKSFLLTDALEQGDGGSEGGSGSGGAEGRGKGGEGTIVLVCPVVRS